MFDCLDSDSYGYVLSTNLFSTFSVLQYYERQISHIRFKVNSNISLNTPLPHNFNWLKIYHRWTTNNIELSSKKIKHNNILSNLHLTNNYIIVKDCNIKTYRPLSLGRIINASEHTLHELQLNIGHYNVKSQVIHVLFNPDNATLFKQYYVLPVRAIIAVK